MTDDTTDQRAARTDSSITRLPNGKGWRARPTLGTDPVTSKQVRPTKVFATKKAAQDWVSEQRTNWDKRTWAARSERTFAEAADHWLKLRDADDGVRANSVRADRESLAYARRAFGETAIQKITPEALTDWSIGMTRKSGEPLAAATKRRAIVITQAVFAHAVTMRWLSHDPAAHLKPPSQKVVVAAKESDVWTPKQMKAFLDSVADHRLAGCFALTLLGLRREEVGGLRWSDIDLAKATLSIIQARVDVNGVDTIDDPKNARSVRTLPIPPRELALLKTMHITHKRERLAVGHPLAANDLILARIDGKQLPVRDYTRLFAERRKAAKLPAITLRNLRHSSVSRMRAMGIAADVVAAWHGHSERMTQMVYGRVSDDRLTAASAELSKAVGQS
ncbi:tyrosine-type recombinase/integrase [Nocardia camponoti]|uniref:Integrase n=1 Tax=Nocardia camponoti TaxID=1616106 RepID=A0A917QD83_9NOCA|nr:site-specific integrase [Nocardia camponoti]GGK44829.1 integrase [Nocardia camponoti]